MIILQPLQILATLSIVCLNILKCFQNKYIQIRKYFVMQHAEITTNMMSTQTNMVAFKIKCSFYNHSKQMLYIFLLLKFFFQMEANTIMFVQVMED